MRAVRSAICTSAEPVSCWLCPCLPTISCFASLVRVKSSSFVMRLRLPSPPRGSNTRAAERAVLAEKGSNHAVSMRFRHDLTTVQAAVAAGHPATAQAELEVLEAGGSAAEAAVAASLASCVAETVMTGLLGGGHGIHFEAAARVARNLDGFCSVPSGQGADLVHLEVPFGAELVHYAIGPA